LVPRPCVTSLPNNSLVLALTPFNAFSSVLMAMVCTFFRHPPCMLFTMLFPAPPTPMTAILGSGMPLHTMLRRRSFVTILSIALVSIPFAPDGVH
jgi:hypothetical protein